MAEDGADGWQWAFTAAHEKYRAGADFDDLGPALRRAREDIEELTRLAVVRAHRDQRRSWVTIGDGLGVSRQAAQKKYGYLVAD